MADLCEAFNTMKFEQKQFYSIDYFFTQRNLKEDHEFLDQNMNRKNKQLNIQYNFLAISIPQYDLSDDSSSTIEADIFGDNGYHYKGKITSYKGLTPNFMIPLKGDKKLFVHLIYKELNKKNIDNTKNFNEHCEFSKKKTQDTNEEKSKDFFPTEQKEFTCFIEVPKRFQSVDSIALKLKNESESSVDV